MSKKEIMEFENEYVTEEQFEKIELSEDVKQIENCGNSGVHVSWTWYVVTFVDGEEISIYG